ncbi:MAG: GNAT family N-acetyltransferase [Chloroflexi bacterium CFX7]|nr:GNAT family N-acetyltransferase [Chloroflexi bacterium CFX7]MCK6565180.1 GNAT family N-acetyltransferase [Dehalococcoidia bacterium]
MTIAFRPATSADVPALRDVFGREPSDEQIGIAGGDSRRARRFRELMAAALFTPTGLAATTVAVDDGEVVGFVQSGAEAGLTLRVALGILRIFGRRTPGFVRRDRSRAKVHISPPTGAFHISELHVLASRRNQGLGAALLAETEREARGRGFTQMSLTTTLSNPARRLYERYGFATAATREDPEYRAITGMDGRVLMVKDLA